MPYRKSLQWRALVVILMGSLVLWSGPGEAAEARGASGGCLQCLAWADGWQCQDWVPFACSFCPGSVAAGCWMGGAGCQEDEMAIACWTWPQ
jgi:hypothetical protein